MEEESIHLGLVIAVAVMVAVVTAIFVALPLAAGVLLLGITSATSADNTAVQPDAAVIITSPDTPPDPQNYVWTEVMSGLDNPLLVTHAGDGSGRLFAAEQTGFVLVSDNGEINPQPFLDVSLLLSDDVFQGGYSERGLLGLAFHPEFESNGQLFISHTNRDGHSVLARYTLDPANPDLANPDSRVELLTVTQPFADHNGGNIAFGPDGYLYLGLGDGGNPEIPNYNSQNPQSLLGKILRIDINAETYTVPDTNPFVDAPGYSPEIWALGIRNPWRFTFDRATGDLYIGDVGQWAWEEINFQPADSTGGENYGWSVFEATHPYLEDAELTSDMTPPIFEYPHSEGCSVTGGYVYRGADLPELQSVYFFGDYCTGKTWTTYRDETGNWHTAPFIDTDFIISSFGEDEAGELYVVDYKGSIYRLEAVE